MWQQWIWEQMSCSRQYVSIEGLPSYTVWESVQTTALIHFLNQSRKKETNCENISSV